MIRTLAALARLRWRLLVNGLRGSRRDSLEQVSRVSRLFVAAIMAITLIPASLLLAALAFIGARGLAMESPRAEPVLIGARGVLIAVTMATLIAPILRFGGASGSSTRLALLPVRRGTLHAAELIAQLADPWILLLAPALATLPAGLLAGGAPVAALWAALAGLATAAFLAALGSAASLLAALVFRNRRIGEIAMIAVLLLVSMGAYLPIALQNRSGFGPKATREANARAVQTSAAVLGSSAGPWMRSAPWSLYTRTVEAALPPGSESPVLPLLGLAVITLGFAGASRYAFARLLDAPPERRSRSSKEAMMRRIPGLSATGSAAAWTTFRLIARSVRGRVILFTSPIPVVMIGLLWRRSLGEPAVREVAGILVFSLGAMLALTSMQTVLANQFAVDRAGLTLTFLGPAGARDLVLGKAAGGAMAYALPCVAALLVAAILHPRGSPALWLASVVMVAAVYLVQAPLAALMAAFFPAACDLMKLRAGNAHPLAGVAGMLVVIVTSASCGGLFALTWWGTGSAAAVLAAAFAALALGAVFAAALLPAAARALDARRENLALVAQGR